MYNTCISVLFLFHFTCRAASENAVWAYVFVNYSVFRPLPSHTHTFYFKWRYAAFAPNNCRQPRCGIRV